MRKMNDVWAFQLNRLTDPENPDVLQASPRGMQTYELLGVSLRINMEFPILTVRERKLGYKFMAAEAYWIMSGDNRVSTISPYSKEIANYSDDGETYFGAYGPKIKEQLGHVISSLQQDRDTRQAVVNIWRESPPKSKDIPCTLSLQWLIREGALHCVATMRSSDIMKGLPYDVFNFTMLTHLVRLHIQEPLAMGTLFINLGSSHLYGRDMEVVQRCKMTAFDTIKEPVVPLSIMISDRYTVNSPTALMLLLKDLKDMDGGALHLASHNV